MNNKNHGDNRIKIGINGYAMILAFLGCLGMTGIMSNENSLSFTNSFFALILWGLCVYVLKSILEEFIGAKTSEKVYAYVFSALLSIALHMGAQLELYENVDFTDVWLYLGSACLTVFAAPIIHKLWNHFFVSAKEDNKKKLEKPLKITSVWLIIFLLWVPTFLALYPGAFVYDAADEYIEVISRQFSMHHPLVHVLLLGGLVHLGEYIGLGANAGIALYTVFQMIVFSWIFAYLVIFLQKFNISKKYLLGVILFVGLFPIFPMYAVCSAKDTLFTGAFLIVTILLIWFMKDENEFFNKKVVLFVFASVTMMLLRNNGAYAYIVAIPFMALSLLAKKEKKAVIKLMVLMALSVVLYKGGEYCLKLATNATDNEHQEMLTVPIQQLARVYKYAPETFSAEDKQALYEILPENYLITYTAKCSDVLKSGFDNNAYGKNPGKYRELWLKTGMKKPLIYMNAWLVNCYGYWYPDMIINVYGGNQMYTFQYKDSSYFGFETEPPGERKSLFPLYERFYRNLSLELFQHKVPVLSMLFAPGFVFYIFAWFVLGCMRQKNWKMVAAFMPALLLVCTVLLGPTVLVRYVLILWCILPVMVLRNI